MHVNRATYVPVQEYVLWQQERSGMDVLVKLTEQLLAFLSESFATTRVAYCNVSRVAVLPPFINDHAH